MRKKGRENKTIDFRSLDIQNEICKCSKLPPVSWVPECATCVEVELFCSFEIGVLLPKKTTQTNP